MADDVPRDVVEAVARAIACHSAPRPAQMWEALAALRTLTALGYRRVGPDEVVVHERHADIALGLLDVPQAERGGCWHIEAEGLLRRLAAAPSREGGA